MVGEGFEDLPRANGSVHVRGPGANHWMVRVCEGDPPAAFGPMESVRPFFKGEFLLAG